MVAAPKRALTRDSPLEERAPVIIRRLKKAYPDAKVALHFTNPLECLVATILSAQCTDEQVNKVTATLFKKYRTPEDYLRVPESELAADIKPTGFFNQKAKAIRGACRKIIEDYGGKVPETMAELVTLPGVGRRTAEDLLAEIGTDLTRFPTAGHLASWAGICPGNYESAGKRQRGTTRKGDRWLKTMLVECGWGAGRERSRVRCLLVASGFAPREGLDAAGADHVVDDLTDTDLIVSLLGAG